MRRATALLIPALLLWGLIPITHGGVYRWVDDDGNIHYSDSIPPDQVKSGHTVLSEGGVRIKAVPPVKSPEEVMREQELKRLRAQQEKLLEQHRATDQVLLRTFRSEDDIKVARDGKLAAIDVMIRGIKNNVRRQQQWLARLRGEAANLERTGKPVPTHLSDNIAQTARAIRDAYSTIIDREKQKNSIRASFAQDLKRFRQLKDLPEPESRIPAEDIRPTLQNIVTCSTRNECNRRWHKAIAYVRKHTTTTVQTRGANILITAPPASGQDFSLILSRIEDKEGPGASFLLDLQCKSSLRGEKMCNSERAKRIIEGFRPAIVDGDSAQK
jgi:hypothetical protein